MIKAVFFDAGETLIHRNPSLVNIIKRIFEKAGHNIKTDVLGSVIESSAKSMGKIVEKAVMSDSDKWDYFLKVVFLKLKIKDETALGKIKIKLKKGTSFRAYPEVRLVLKELRAKHVVLGVISNASSYLENILDKAGLKGWFDHIVVSEIEGVEKPHKKIFDIALKKSGVKRSEFMFVGDNYIADVTGAKNAGLNAIWLSRPTKNAQFSYAHTALETTRKVASLRGFLHCMKKEKML